MTEGNLGAIEQPVDIGLQSLSLSKSRVGIAKSRILLIALVIVLPLFNAALVLKGNPILWVDLLFDDAYYYLAIARHISMHFESVFGPPFSTNGYQPLWQIILSAVSFLARADRRILAALAQITILGCHIVFLVLSKNEKGQAWPAALAILSFPIIASAGMETVLILPLALMYFRSNDWRSRGVFASLLFLARLDALGLILGRQLFEFVFQRRIEVRANITLTITVAAYAVFNYFEFGSPVPVSGLAKAVGNVPGENYFVGLNAIIVSLPMIAIFGCLSIINPKKFSEWKNSSEIFSSLVALACSAIYYSTMSGWNLWAWYFWPLMLLFYYAILEVAQLRPDRRISVLAGQVVVFLLAIQSFTSLHEYWGRYNAIIKNAFSIENSKLSWGQTNVLMAQAINKSGLPAGKTFAMGDRAGSFGYLLDDRFRIFQTEGLVTSYDYIQALRADQGEAFLENIAHVDWLIVDRGHFWSIDGIFAVPEPIQGLSAKHGPFLMCFPQDALVTEFSSFVLRPERKVFDYSRKVKCPESAIKMFAERRAVYGQLRWNSLWPKKKIYFPSPFPLLR